MEQKKLPFNFEATQNLNHLFKCEKLDFAKIKQEVFKGADVNTIIDEKENLSPLLIAISKQQAPIAYFLLCYGASPTHFNSRGQDCLEYAILTGQTELAKILLNLGAKPNRYNVYGETVLNLAVKLGNVEIVKSLIKRGADVNMPSLKVKLTPLKIAKGKGFNEIEKILKSSGAKEVKDMELCM